MGVIATISALNHLREFRSSRPSQCGGRRGPIPLRGIGYWLNLPDTGDGPTLGKADYNLQRSVTLRRFPAQAVDYQCKQGRGTIRGCTF